MDGGTMNVESVIDVAFGIWRGRISVVPYVDYNPMTKVDLLLRLKPEESI